MALGDNSEEVTDRLMSFYGIEEKQLTVVRQSMKMPITGLSDVVSFIGYDDEEYKIFVKFAINMESDNTDRGKSAIHCRLMSNMKCTAAGTSRMIVAEVEVLINT